MGSFRAGVDSWNRYDRIDKIDDLEQRYVERWALYTGTFLNDSWKRSSLKSDIRIYKNVNLLLKHVEGVVDFYASTVYQGNLSTDGEPLPNSLMEAIPIDPQTEDEEQDRIIRVAFAELCTAWNWKANMSQRPMFAAALGDVLTELIDDVEKGFVYPSIVWPGYVKDIELDYVGNVKYYALEYRVTERHPQKNGSQSYLFRKEVDTKEIRYYRDSLPFDQFGAGAVEENPYGFVPAIWDRHRSLWDERGGSAIDGTKQALIQVNSLLSHGFDFQRKAFLAPIMVKGSFIKPKQSRIQIGRPPVSGLNEYQMEQEQTSIAESVGVLPIAGDNVALLQPQFDIGQTRELIKDIYEGILSENPEASFYKELRKMSVVTGPGAERMLGDAVARSRRVRAGHDTNTVKLFQMAMTIAGMRITNGEWTDLSRRQRAFETFSLESFKAGEMDFGILDRPIVPPTEHEVLDIILKKETIKTDWGLEEAGFSEEEITALNNQREAQNNQLGQQMNSGQIPTLPVGSPFATG